MNYNFKGQYSEQDKTLFKSAQKDDLEHICDYLKTNISLLDRIKFEIFDSRKAKQESDPHHSISRASARFREMTIYRFWQVDEDPHFPHEITHLVAHTWVKPYTIELELDTWDEKIVKKSIDMVSTSFMQEGLAIAVDDVVFGRDLLEGGELKTVDSWCKLQFNQMPKSLKEVINLEGFNSVENKISVPFAASFSKFLLQTFGLGKYKQMYTSLRETYLPEKNILAIEDIYLKTEKELLMEWKQALLTKLQPVRTDR